MNIYVEDAQEGARLIVVVLLNKAMDKPSFVEALQKQTEGLEKEAGNPSIVGTSELTEEVATQTHMITENEVLHTSVVKDVVNTCIHLNLISDDNLNSYISPLMTKYHTPTPPQSNLVSKELFSIRYCPYNIISRGFSKSTS